MPLPDYLSPQGTREDYAEVMPAHDIAVTRAPMPYHLQVVGARDGATRVFGGGSEVQVAGRRAIWNGATLIRQLVRLGQDGRAPSA